MNQNYDKEFAVAELAIDFIFNESESLTQDPCPAMFFLFVSAAKWLEAMGWERNELMNEVKDMPKLECERCDHDQ
jgi:hypothetical protein